MNPDAVRSIAFLGAGRVGSALARAFVEAGHLVTAVASRSMDAAERLAEPLPDAAAYPSLQGAADAADLVFLTVPDDAIAEVAAAICWRPGQSAVHCSGARSLEALDVPRRHGVAVGSLHPLQTFADRDDEASMLSGASFAVEASDPSLEAQLTELARSVGGLPFTLGGSKGLYHASAVLACNNLVTLLDAAAGLWVHLGLSKQEGLRALLPLVRGTIENLDAIGLPAALTGPVARGDVGTIDRNLSALREHAPETADLYVELARRTIPIAEAKGSLSPAAAARLHERLDAAPRCG